MYKFLALTSLIGLFLIYTGCDRGQKIVTSQTHQETLKIGFMVAGTRAVYLNGAQLAVDEINTTGGILGTPIELVSLMNIEAVLPLSIQAAEDMILKDKVIAIIGPNRSTHAIAVGPIAQRYGVPMITTSASNPDVTKAGNFVFMTSATDTFQSKIMAAFALDELKADTAAVLTRSGDVYTEGLGGFFTTNFSAIGGEIVATEFYEEGTTDFTTQLTRVAAAGPDVFFLATFGDEVASITQQARALSIRNRAGDPTIFLGGDSWDTDILFENEKAEIEGSFFAAHFSTETDAPAARAFIDTYHAIYGETPTGGIAVNYDAVKLLFEAIERAESIEPTAIRDELRATENYIGATQIGHYDENRHPSKSAVILTIKDGKKQFYKQIDPF